MHAVMICACMQVHVKELYRWTMCPFTQYTAIVMTIVFVFRHVHKYYYEEQKVSANEFYLTEK